MGSDLVFPINVFVYGTLKSECSNHIKMEEADAQFLCKAKTKGKRLLTIQGLPFLHDGEFPDGFQVEGEIYQIPNTKGLEILDWFEGNGEFYQRKQDLFIDLVTSEEISAWVYYILEDVPGPKRRVVKLRGWQRIH